MGFIRIGDMRRVAAVPALALILATALVGGAWAQQAFIQIEAKRSLAEAEAAARQHARRIGEVSGFEAAGGWYVIAQGSLPTGPGARPPGASARRAAGAGRRVPHRRRPIPAAVLARRRGGRDAVGGRPVPVHGGSTACRRRERGGGPRFGGGAGPCRAGGSAGGPGLGRRLRRPDRRGLRTRHPRGHGGLAGRARARAHGRADDRPENRAGGRVRGDPRRPGHGDGAGRSRRDRGRDARRPAVPRRPRDAVRPLRGEGRKRRLGGDDQPAGRPPHARRPLRGPADAGRRPARG